MMPHNRQRKNSAQRGRVPELLLTAVPRQTSEIDFKIKTQQPYQYSNLTFRNKGDLKCHELRIPFPHDTLYSRVLRGTDCNAIQLMFQNATSSLNRTCRKQQHVPPLQIFFTESYCDSKVTISSPVENKPIYNMAMPPPTLPGKAQSSKRGSRGK